MQRLIGGVGQGEAKDSFLRVGWNPGEDMVSSGGIAAASNKRSVFSVSQSGSQSSREDRGPRHRHLCGRGGLQRVNMASYVTACRRENARRGVTCKHHLGGRWSCTTPAWVPFRGWCATRSPSAILSSSPCPLSLRVCCVCGEAESVRVSGCGHVLEQACSSPAVAWSAPIGCHPILGHPASLPLQ